MYRLFQLGLCQDLPGGMDRPVFVQQELRVVQYLKRVIITSVIGVLTGPHSCQKAMHPGNA